MNTFNRYPRNLGTTLATLFLLLASVSSLTADPPTVVQSQSLTQQIGFSYYQFVACGNAGAGEWVSFKGTNTWTSTIEHASDGKISVIWKLAGTEANGTGLESGITYSLRENEVDFAGITIHSLKDDDPEISSKVNWKARVLTNEGALDFPLTFSGEIRVNLDTQKMGFTFEEINTGCNSVLTSVK